MLLRSPGKLSRKKTQSKICKYKIKQKSCTQAKKAQASKPPKAGKCHCCSLENSPEAGGPLKNDQKLVMAEQ